MGRAWDFAEDSVVDVIGKKRSLHSKLHRPFLLSLFLCSLLYLIRLPSRRRKASPSFPAFFLSIVSINSFLRLEFSCFSCSFLTVYIVCECRLLGFHISFLKLIWSFESVFPHFGCFIGQMGNGLFLLLVSYPSQASSAYFHYFMHKILP